MRKENSRNLLIFGRKRQGKTTLAVHEMIQSLEKGDYVFSNIKIEWFGDLFYPNWFDAFKNKVYNFFAGNNIKRLEKIIKLEANYKDLVDIANETVLDLEGFPSNNLRTIYLDQFKIITEIKKLKEINKNVEFGYVKKHWYPEHRYQYHEDLNYAIQEIVNDARQNPDRNYLLCWDEGFIDLNHKSGVPEEITAFFNEAGKLSIDIIVCAQRPVAIYPAFRALCDYMILVEKEKILGFETGNFKGKMFYVDSDANALPDLSKDAEGKNKGEDYGSWRGKDIFPYFKTRESIAIKKLFNRFKK